MKRFLSLILCHVLLVLSFSACSGKATEIRILNVENSASVFLSHLLEENNEKADYKCVPSITNLPNTVRTFMADGECDVAVVPVETAAIIRFKSAPKIKVIAGISVGGFELLTNKSISDLSELKGQKVYLTKRNSLMENLLKYLVSLYGVDPFEEISFGYANDNQELLNMLSANETAFALFDSADAAYIKSNLSNVLSFNLTDEYSKKFKNPSIVNYCVVATEDFIKNNPKAIKRLLSDIESSVKKSSDAKTTLALAKKHNILTKDNLNEDFLKSLKADFVSGEKMKQKLSAYYKIIHKVKASLIGNKIPDDDFYYISKK